MSSTELVEALDALSVIIAPIGVAKAPFESLAQATLADVRALRASVGAWAETQHDDLAAIARLVVECADLTVNCAAAGMTAATRLLKSVQTLLEAYAAARDGVTERLGRPIWLLDGWRHLTALWASVAEQPIEAQRDAMIELGDLVPLVPLSADEWLDQEQKGRSQYEIQRYVRLNEDWRTGLLIERQALLEELQAASL